MYCKMSLNHDTVHYQAKT